MTRTYLIYSLLLASLPRVSPDLGIKAEKRKKYTVSCASILELIVFHLVRR